MGLFAAVKYEGSVFAFCLRCPGDSSCVVRFLDDLRNWTFVVRLLDVLGIWIAVAQLLDHLGFWTVVVQLRKPWGWGWVDLEPAGMPGPNDFPNTYT